MENLGGLDEVEVKENKTEETVVSLEEKKAKRKPFHYWEVNGRQFRLKLKASTVGKLENKYHQNIMNMLDDIPPLETIISSCISAAVTLLVCLISNHSQNEKTRALMEYKLEELTKRVDKHNNVVERTYSLEQKAVVQEEQIKVANHRISDLEEKENGHV